MNAPSSWSGPKVSRLWSAKGDERCSPPRSDDYKDWSLSQLKREITQRQLKTNPRRRNKDAFVKVLLSHDQQQTQTLEPPVEEPVLFVPTSTSELQNIYVNSGDQQQQQQVQDIYGNNTTQDMYRSDAQQPQDVYRDNAGQQPHQPQPQPQDIYVDRQPQQDAYGSSAEQQQQQIFASVGMMQPAPLTPPTSMPQLQAQVQTQTQTPVPVEAMSVVPAPVPAPASAPAATEAEVETPQSFQSTVKRQRLAGVRQENEGSEHVNAATSETARPGSSTCTQQVVKGSTEYLRRKLGIQAARLEIESRRLDLETKREQRNSELHAVQLALAQEQLQQAKMTTQKMKTEWMVEQMIQKKRLNDAGISQEDSAALGMYLS